MRHLHTCLTFCFADRTNTPPFSSAALPLRLRLRETRICSPFGTGAARNQISDVAVIILSSSAEDVESMKGSPLCVSETPSPSFHLALAPCPPLSPCAFSPAASQETRIPRCHPITSPHRATRRARRGEARPGTRESDDLPVAAERPPWLHSALAMPWP